MAMNVAGKTAIITGAGSGINFALAQLLLSKDCNVIIADLTLRQEAQLLVSGYTSQPRCIFRKTDVKDWLQLKAVFDAATEVFDGADIVCPGAGVYEPVSKKLSNLKISRANTPTASIQLLHPSRDHSQQGHSSRLALRNPRHQPRPSNPHNPARNRTFPSAQKARSRSPHFKCSRPSPFLPYTLIRSLKTCNQRLRTLSLPP